MTSKIDLNLPAGFISRGEEETGLPLLKDGLLSQRTLDHLLYSAAEYGAQQMLREVICYIITNRWFADPSHRISALYEALDDKGEFGLIKQLIEAEKKGFVQDSPEQAAGRRMAILGMVHRLLAPVEEGE